jgi:hypothetical protein
LFSSVRAKVINGDAEFTITANQWPRGVYKKGMYDPTNPSKGLFQSMSLLQVRRASFIRAAIESCTDVLV